MALERSELSLFLFSLHFFPYVPNQMRETQFLSLLSFLFSVSLNSNWVSVFSWMNLHVDYDISITNSGFHFDDHTTLPTSGSVLICFD